MDSETINALELELRRDLEALERVKRLISVKNGALKRTESRETVNSPAPAETTIAEHPEEDASDLNLPATSLRGRIETIINEDLSVRWTVQKMIKHLTDTGFQLKAAKPIFSVGQAMKKLSDQGKIRLVRRGTGSEPNVYRGKETKDMEARPNPNVEATV